MAALFIWVGIVQGRLSFAPWRNAWARVAWGSSRTRWCIRRSTRLNI